MGIQRALTLFPRNDTTVDSGALVNIRLLGDTAGASDVTQSVIATHAQDNVERTFNPATLNGNAVRDAFALQPLGWGLRLADDMTPGDDTNCDVVLPAQTVTVNLDVGVDWAGNAPTLPNIRPTWKVALFKYNPATDTGSLIASGSLLTPNNVWNSGTKGTFLTMSPTITVAAPVTFGSGEILVLQIGLNTGTLQNPLSGTTTYGFTLRLASVTSMVLTSKLVQTCALSTDLVGAGVLSEGGKAITMSDDLVGEGVLARGLDVAVARDLVGEGAVSRGGLDVGVSRSVVGDGTVTESQAQSMFRTFDLVGEGVISRGLDVVISRSLVGDGILEASKAAAIGKTFDLVGEGTITEVHPVQAFRTFDLVGVGAIVDSTITMPLDEIPSGDCPSDWPDNDGLKAISGVVYNHENGSVVSGATVCLVRDSDAYQVGCVVSGVDGTYSFPRDSADPYTYHVVVTTGSMQGASESGCAPS